MKSILLLNLLLFFFVACSSQEKKESVVSTTSAKADVTGKVTAKVSFTPTEEGVLMKVYASGFSPNKTHGFHIHEKGVCDKPDYKSAGDHFNPGEHSHGGPAAPIKHVGDLGNLVSNDKGVAEKEILMRDLRDVNLIKNKAIIIHEKADDLASQPTGNAGGRIACGIIRLE
ncbi:MAG TPA: superoxide dismutase family protein [Bacteriovoracaceae bacterium]|nr:superoxide dismutase family protein [Bacteriovoracaceae bacterium]